MSEGVHLEPTQAKALSARERRCSDSWLKISTGMTALGSEGKIYVVNDLWEPLFFSMHVRVAVGAQRGQIVFLIAPRLATEFEVVYVEVLHAAAELASPTVALQYLLVQFAVAIRVESEWWVLGTDLPAHEIFWLTSDRKASFCGPGRKL